MKILAFETSTYACSVALKIDGDIIHRFEMSPRRHGELILSWAEELLQEAGITRAELDAVAVSRGPGSFTSLRLGMSAAVAVAFALEIPVIPISSLQALAWEALHKHGVTHVLSVIDARMSELYCAAYALSAVDEHHKVLPLTREMLTTPELILLPDQFNKKEWVCAGNALMAKEFDLAKSFNKKEVKLDADCWPSARAVAALSSANEAIAAEDFEPIYLRNRVAEPPKAKSKA